MYIIKMNNSFTGERYGLMFIGGEAQTDNKFLADRLSAKGFEVSDITPELNAAETEKTEDDPETKKRGKIK